MPRECAPYSPTLWVLPWHSPTAPARCRANTPTSPSGPLASSAPTPTPSSTPAGRTTGPASTTTGRGTTTPACSGSSKKTRCWISLGPIGTSAMNAPTRYVDPSGNLAVGAIIGTSIGFYSGFAGASVQGGSLTQALVAGGRRRPGGRAHRYH